MKARREHRVPLADRALEILVEARELDGHGSGLVFPAGQNGKPLSNATHLALLRRLGIPAVPHGFRSSFKDWCMERTDIPWDCGGGRLGSYLGQFNGSSLRQKRPF